jgi:carboxylesterase
VRASLGRVEAPILVAHGAHDRTANPRDAQEIARSVGSRQVQVLRLADSGHVVPVDRDGPRLAEAVAGFLAGLA